METEGGLGMDNGHDLGHCDWHSALSSLVLSFLPGCHEVSTVIPMSFCHAVLPHLRLKAVALADYGLEPQEL